MSLIQQPLSSLQHIRFSVDTFYDRNSRNTQEKGSPLSGSPKTPLVGRVGAQTLTLCARQCACVYRGAGPVQDHGEGTQACCLQGCAVQWRLRSGEEAVPSEKMLEQTARAKGWRFDKPCFGPVRGRKAPHGGGRNRTRCPVPAFHIELRHLPKRPPLPPAFRSLAPSVLGDLPWSSLNSPRGP